MCLLPEEGNSQCKELVVAAKIAGAVMKHSVIQAGSAWKDQHHRLLSLQAAIATVHMNGGPCLHSLSVQSIQHVVHHELKGSLCRAVREACQ